MPVVLYNTLTRSKQELVPVNPGKVSIYTCGPTVYRYAHIGNLRAYVFSDLVRRTLELMEYDVHHVMNITDVGHLESDADEGRDKVLQAAKEEQKSPFEVAKYYERAFFKDTELLNIKRPHVCCRASDHIDEMIDIVARLMENGYAYQIKDGVYFDVSRFSDYGKLSRTDLDANIAGARVEVNPDKRHPADFALWKRADASHSMSWDSPWGRGFPGWHIECTAMAMKYLGDRIDIHTGGIDHIPIHHENEIAQFDCTVGRKVVNNWIHNEFLVLDAEKMSKSKGNVLLLTDVVNEGYSPLAFRYLCLNAHYRKRANFTWEAISSAQAGLQNLKQQIAELGDEQGQAPAKLVQPVKEALADDFNAPRALAALWEGLRDKHYSAADRRALAVWADQVLGLELASTSRSSGVVARSILQSGTVEIEGLSAEEVNLLVEREQARQNKDWSEADRIRDQLVSMGVKVEDGRDEVKWVKGM